MEKIHSSMECNISGTNKLMRLQRANKDLAQLSYKLNSYINEPYTQTLYEQFQSLRLRLENLRHINDEVLLSYQDRKNSFGEIAHIIKKQLEDFKELQQGVFDYTRTVKAVH